MNYIELQNINIEETKEIDSESERDIITNIIDTEENYNYNYDYRENFICFIYVLLGIGLLFLIFYLLCPYK